jgi:magnesium chelatase subunit I
MIDMTKIRTLGQLKKEGYQSKNIKTELRDNLISKLRQKENVFEGIWGFEETVIPDLERAVLARHDINLLGLRGQAKTRIARLMTHLLDEYIPVIEGSDLNDDPFNPISRYGKDKVAELGDDTPVAWMHRSERYTEKLATPDVSIADLIGDVTSATYPRKPATIASGLVRSNPRGEGRLSRKPAATLVAVARATARFPLIPLRIVLPPSR